MLIALDVGSFQTRIASAGKAAVLCEPTLVANCPALPVGVAVGQVAVPFLERAPQRVGVYRPVVSGHLASPAALQEQLRQLLKRHGLKPWSRPYARLVLPSVASPLERKQWAQLLKEIGFLGTHIVSMPVAVAWGSHEESASTQPAVAVVDMGATTTEMALVSADVVMRRSISWGGDDLDRAVHRCLHQDFGLEVSLTTARSVKHNLSCWGEHWRPGETVEVRGRQLSTGLPVYHDVAHEALGQALHEPLMRVVELVKGVLDQMPPLLAEEVLTQGVVLSGAAAYLQGLEPFLHGHLNLPVRRAGQAAEAAVLGALRVRPELAMEP